MDARHSHHRQPRRGELLAVVALVLMLAWGAWLTHGAWLLDGAGP
ncbi:MAG TPA: hypothetical protein VFP37_16160 [Steroidobacteraceae bacterium]|nr:hypothetical protein [Steroidobacteraceae bacterium]